MTTKEAVQKVRDFIRLKHFAWSTEESYCRYVHDFCEHSKRLPPGTPAEKRIESYLSTFARRDASASSQPQFQAFGNGHHPIQAEFSWQWFWLFPAKGPCKDKRNDDRLVRWHLGKWHIERAVKRACNALGLSVVPHELRHGYATDCLNAGTNPRALQKAMGHKSLETTMGYCHAEALSVKSPLDQRCWTNEKAGAL